MANSVLNPAGGKIIGKSTCEAYCVSGGSHTGYPYVVKNPAGISYSAAGSSSGSGALVAAGNVDLALGTDQGGSVRMPAAWCGIVGMKATFGEEFYWQIALLQLTIMYE